MKNIVIISSLTFFVLLCTGGGVLTGIYIADRPYSELLEPYKKIETLGRMYDSEEQKQAVSKAYYDTGDAFSKIDTFVWAPANVPTPFLGCGLLPGSYHNTTINSMQFRVPYELESPKPNDHYRIFFTGGSTAFGSAASSDQTIIAGYLERLLNKKLAKGTGKSFQVITAANPAWASTHERILIENRLSELEADLVISFSGNNDVHWGIFGKDIFWFRTYHEELFWQLIQKAYDRNNYYPMEEITQSGAPIAPDLVAQRVKKNIRLASYALEDVPYLYFLQPTLPVVNKPLSEREKAALREEGKEFDDQSIAYFRGSYRAIAETLKQANINNFHFSDLSQVFDSYSQEDEIFVDSYHYGDRGNEIVANAIYEEITETILGKEMVFAKQRMGNKADS